MYVYIHARMHVYMYMYVYVWLCMYSAPAVYRPPIQRHPRLPPQTKSERFSPYGLTLLTPPPAVRQPPHVSGVRKWWSPPYTATCVRWCSAWLVAFTQRLLCKHACTCKHAPASGYCFKNPTCFLSPNIDYLNTHGCDTSCRSSTHINCITAQWWNQTHVDEKTAEQWAPQV